MRSVIISAVLLAVTTVGMTANIFYMDTALNEMIESVEALPTENVNLGTLKDSADEIVRSWEKKKSAVTFLVDYRQVDEADMACKRLYNSICGDDICAYLVYRDEFIHALNRLLDISLITAENIL